MSKIQNAVAFTKGIFEILLAFCFFVAGASIYNTNKEGSLVLFLIGFGWVGFGTISFKYAFEL